MGQFHSDCGSVPHNGDGGMTKVLQKHRQKNQVIKHQVIKQRDEPRCGGATLALQRLERRARIVRKRCGTSQNIGAMARAKAEMES